MAPLLLRPAATPIDWEVIKGETFDIRVPVLDEDDAQVDVTGWTAKAQIRRTEHEPVLHEWSTDAGNATCAAAGVTLAVEGAATSAWGWRDARLSIEVYEPLTSKPHVIAQGVIRALPEITQ